MRTILRVALWAFCGLSLIACEAPLDLSGVAAERNKPIQRFDMFQAIAATEERIAAVSSSGAVLLSEDYGDTWTREDLNGAPALIDLAACPNGGLHALDSLRGIWSLSGEASTWERSSIDTIENLLSISCTPANDLWIGASFGTTFVSRDAGDTWREWSLNDDLQITAIDFVDADTGFAVGEFGTFLKTTDGGMTWRRGNALPNEFYSMAAEFIDESRGWVGGLDGVIWQTDDGGETWERGQSPNKAPIYGVVANRETVVAVGEGGTVAQLHADGWTVLDIRPPLLAYLRGIRLLPDGDVLVAGGGGTLLRIPLTNATASRS